MILQSYGEDHNNDGKPEQWNITLGLRLPQNTQLASIDVVASFAYETQESVAMQFEGLAHL